MPPTGIDNVAKDAAKGVDLEVAPYSMHVSAKYLELTKKKVQMTRLPRELELEEGRRWAQGTPKAVLEPILDYWLEHYDWRTQEAIFNRNLPQFRTTVQIPASSSTPATSVTPGQSSSPDATQSLRIHFVHKRSKHAKAIPLLFCHSWPSSFIEVHRIIDALTDPHSLPGLGTGAQQAFHVVCPSIPGFGFSDSSSSEEFGLEETGRVFQEVMRRLGYEKFVAHGSGWGFGICRALALYHPANCVAVHTVNPVFTEPTFKRSPMAYIKHRIAKLTRAKIPLLNFGYTPTEVQAGRTSKLGAGKKEGALHDHKASVSTLEDLYSLRPQTVAFSLCDSPIGLLAALLDIIHMRSPSSTPLASRSRSPFLDPGELEMQGGSGHEDEIRAGDPEAPFSPGDSDVKTEEHAWTRTEMLNWTMMQWLPGPEASLRWLQRAHAESTHTARLWTSFCAVPVGISTFNSSRQASKPVMWGSTTSNIAWVKRNQRAAHQPAWEVPDLLVLDMRECFGTFLSHGIMANLPLQAS